MTDWRQDGSGRITDAQRRMLNAVCGDLAKQMKWHGEPLDKDEWRHLFSGIAASWRVLRGYDHHDGRPAGIVMLGRSSLKLTRTQARDAITMAVHLGDHPDEQGIQSQPVRWSDAVLHGLGFNPNDLKG